MVGFLSSLSVQDLVQTYGLWMLAAVVLLECMGVPLPGETALLAAAIYAGSTHQLSIGSVVVVAATAAVVGGGAGYAIGRSAGIPLISRYGRYVRLNEPRLKVGQYLFLRHGGKIVFLGRFVPLLRTFAAMLAGANRMHLPYFLLVNALGGVAWALLLGSVAYLFGDQVRSLAGPASLLLAVAAALVLAGAYLFFRKHEKELESRALTALPGPWS